MSYKVTVIIPTYNSVEFLDSTIASIMNQSIGFENIELIIVDDCSNDNTFQITEEYSSCDNRIRVIHNVCNQKLPESLNIGFRQAKGEYLTWTSDDNMYLPDALKIMIID